MEVSSVKNVRFESLGRSRGMTSTIRRASAVSALALAAALLAPAAASPAAGTNAIHPGVQTRSPSGQCTANFIFSDSGGTYIGQAAHCTGTGAATETDGCKATSLPEGTAVTVGGASKPGTMVYNSWVRMRAAGETNANTCAYNDLALVKLDPADVANVDPTVPFWGGPAGTNTSGCAGGKVYSYGNSSLRAGVSALSPKTGLCVSDDGGGWSHKVATATPGIPGDSGSAFLDATGQALGVLSTIEIAPVAGSNNIGDINKELGYARVHGFPGMTLTMGTRPFSGT
jgi:hypothetical protein